MELEALAAIFDEEFRPDDAHPETRFTILINDLDFLKDTIVLSFRYPPTYPEVAPEFDIEPTLQLTGDQKERVREAMAAAAEEELGCAMVFSMVTAAKDWLTENFVRQPSPQPSPKPQAPRRHARASLARSWGRSRNRGLRTRPQPPQACAPLRWS